MGGKIGRFIIAYGTRIKTVIVTTQVERVLGDLFYCSFMFLYRNSLFAVFYP